MPKPPKGRYKFSAPPVPKKQVVSNAHVQGAIADVASGKSAHITLHDRILTSGQRTMLSKAGWRRRIGNYFWEPVSRCTVQKKIRLGGYPLGISTGSQWITIAPAKTGTGLRVRHRGKLSEPISSRTLAEVGFGKNASGGGWNTAGIKVGEHRVTYLEHTVAALVGAGITDAIIEVNQKHLPIFGGLMPGLGDTPERVFGQCAVEEKRLQGRLNHFT